MERYSSAAWSSRSQAIRTVVSFQARPRVGAVELMGRLGHVVVLPNGSSLLAAEQSGSDRPNGDRYLRPPAGDHPFTFTLDGDPAVAVAVALHAR